MHTNQKAEKMKRHSVRGVGIAASMTAVASAAVLMAPSLTQEASAQVPFRIARPGNGANVRETVRITVPRAGLEGVQYLSLSIDGRFRSALGVPPARADGKVITSGDQLVASNKNVVLLWDTKAKDKATPNLTEEQRVVNDGPHSLEITALDSKGKRVAQQTITVNVNNKGGLSIPSGGVPLNFRFQVGDDIRYRQTTDVKYITDTSTAPAPTTRRRGYTPPGAGQGGFPGAEDGMGGPPPGFGGPPPGFGGPPPGFGGPPAGFGGGGRGGFGGRGGRGGGGFGGQFGPPGGFPGGGPGMGYTPSGPLQIQVQNVRADFERSTEDYVGSGLYFLRDRVLGGVIIGGNGAVSRLQNVYDFKSRYRQVYTSGQVREYGVASAVRPGAYVAMPIPNLGGGQRRKGSTWRTQTPVLLEWATLDKPPMVFATNTLEDVEWQDGYQTARIQQTYQGKVDMPIFGGAGTMSGANVKMERTIWFAYKAGKIIRMDTTVEVDGNAPQNILTAMVPGASVGGAGGGFGGGPFGGGGFGLAGEDGGFVPPSFGGPGVGPGGMGGGLGGLQQTQEAPKVPAKFISTTRVQLMPPGAKVL